MVVALAIAVIPTGTAAPIDGCENINDDSTSLEDYFVRHFSKAYVDTFKILKTILLAYISHAMTVRPDPSTETLPTLYKRLSALAWPTSGVYEAVDSIVKGFD
ncbi:hypothetical protein CLU79DRAFT_723889 [Phycomyces nitens]|nr:hypothetical protein CLU79DRAFT_723889 [Phycomyces nitens]